MGDYEWSVHSNEATTDENVELMHSLIICDRRRSLYDIAKQKRLKFWGSSVCLDRYLRDVQGLS